MRLFHCFPLPPAELLSLFKIKGSLYGIVLNPITIKLSDVTYVPVGGSRRCIELSYNIRAVERFSGQQSPADPIYSANDCI